MRYLLSAAALALVSALLLGACGGSDAPKENAVSLDEWSIKGDLDVPQGTVLQVTNDGSILHDLIIGTGDVRTPRLEAGDRTTLDLGGLAPGEYELWCSLPHHRAEGMQAILTVTSPAPTSD